MSFPRSMVSANNFGEMFTAIRVDISLNVVENVPF